MKSGERIFGARVRSQFCAGESGQVGGRDEARSARPILDFDADFRLRELLDRHSNPGQLERMPIVVQSAVCDSVSALFKLASGNRELREADRFLARHALPHHGALLEQSSPPPKYRDWREFQFFTHIQRIWQSRIYHASMTLREASSVATGTDELAQLIADQIEREITGAMSSGQVYTALRRTHGRPPSIEASVKYGNGLLAIDGKDPVVEKDILKIANDCSAAARLHSEYRWVQPVLLLPCGSDLRSDAMLSSALDNRVIVATTGLPTRPLGLSKRRLAYQ